MEKSETLGELNPNQRNPRRMSEDQRAALRKSLEEFGPLDGFVFNRRSKTLVGGHQRRNILSNESRIVILERLNQPNAQGTTARGYVEANGERITYREVDWKPAKEKAGMIAANKHSGEWETEALAEIFNELEKDDRELSGFSDLEIAHLIQALPKELGKNNPNAEWEGMPEFVGEDLRADSSVKINFKSPTEREAFARLVGQNVTEKTISIWYPAEPSTSVTHLRYESE